MSQRIRQIAERLKDFFWPELARDKYPVYLLYPPATRVDYEKICMDLLLKNIVSVAAIALIVGSSVFFFPQAPILFHLIKPFLSHLFLPFWLFFVLVFSSAALVRLRLLGKFDTTALAWIGYATFGLMASYIYYLVTLLGGDVIPTLIASTPLILFMFALGRFLLSGWKLTKAQHAEAEREIQNY